MAVDRLTIDDRLVDYLSAMAPEEHPSIDELRRETAHHEFGHMQSAPEQLRFLGLLLRIVNPKRILEVGCFTGLGTLSMALAAQDAIITTLDINDDWVAIGRSYWRKAGVDDRIKFQSGLASESMRALCAQNLIFDFIYIDADKKSYPAYLELSLQLLRCGGMVALDNMLWGGSVADQNDKSKQAKALREVALSIRNDQQLTSCLLPIGDGLMLVRKEV